MLRYIELESGGNKRCQPMPENNNSWSQEDHSGRKTTRRRYSSYGGHAGHVEEVGVSHVFLLSPQHSLLIY